MESGERVTDEVNGLNSAAGNYHRFPRPSKDFCIKTRIALAREMAPCGTRSLYRTSSMQSTEDFTAISPCHTWRILPMMLSPTASHKKSTFKSFYSASISIYFFHFSGVGVKCKVLIAAADVGATHFAPLVAAAIPSSTQLPQLRG